MKNPNISGIIHSMSLAVDSCWGVEDGVAVIFCITHIEPPTRIGRSSGAGFSLEYRARSSHRNVPSSGTTSWTGGSHGYSLPARSASLSGVEGNVPLRAQNRPMKMGICTIMGPRHPRGLTPCSL